MPEPAIAVVCLQLGGPDSIEAIGPFLYNLFSDPDIIDFPGAFLARKSLARLIASRRSPVVAERYREIGGKSPILDLTRTQTDALQRELRRTVNADVYIAMRYWHPLTGETISAMRQKQYDKVILLPLYPQYSRATTVSSVKEWKRECALMGYTDVPTETICCYHNHPRYIEAIAENINRTYERFAGIGPEEIDIIFSAHGVPVSLVRKGDPYKNQIEETVMLVTERGAWKSPHTLCYQSKVGPAKWLGPSLPETIARLAREGRRHLLVVPIAFVTEHIETLHEINIEARAEAEHLGIARFEMMPALNDHPKFIQCLAELVLANV